MTDDDLISALCAAGVPRTALSTETAITTTLPQDGGHISIIERADDDGQRWLVVHERDGGGPHWFVGYPDRPRAIERVAAMFTDEPRWPW